MLNAPTRLVLADLPDLLALSERLAWTFTGEDLTTLLTAGEAYGHRDEAGRVLTSSFLVEYGPELAWLAAVMVDPSLRRQGLGRAIVQRCLDARTPAGAPVALVATPEGALLYEAMGFAIVEQVHKYVAPRAPQAPVGARIRPARPADLPELVRLDAASRGAPRPRLLQARLAQASRAALLLDASDRSIGFGLAIQQRELLILGPLAAPDAGSALALVGHLAAGHPGPLRIDLPDGRQDFADLLLAQGFVLQHARPLMLLPGNGRLPRGPTLFALAAMAYG